MVYISSRYAYISFREYCNKMRTIVILCPNIRFRQNLYFGRTMRLFMGERESLGRPRIRYHSVSCRMVTWALQQAYRFRWWWWCRWELQPRPGKQPLRCTHEKSTRTSEKLRNCRWMVYKLKYYVNCSHLYKLSHFLTAAHRCNLSSGCLILVFVNRK